MSAAYDVAAYLTSLGQGTIYVGNEPANKSALTVTIYDTGGPIGESWAGYQDPTIQIRARALSYPTGYDKLVSIRDALILPRGFTYGGWHYTGFWLISDVAKIGRDDTNRELFTLNLRLMREPSET